MNIELSHHVSEIPAQERLPKPYEREVTARTSSVPDFQSATSNYAASANWLSGIGSTVAIASSNAVAKEIGTELGKNPKGDLGLTLTQFDEVLNKTYANQANSTLSIQANKLINQSNLELANVPRITPQLIAETQNNISLGLQNIFKYAPSEIRPDLEYRATQMQESHVSNLTHRMIQEQKEDQRANTLLASQVHAENAYTLALQGNDKAALAALNATKKANEADVAARIITPLQAKTNIDTARVSYLSGKYINLYEQAKSEGKGEEYLKKLADKKPSDISDADYSNVTSNLMQHINRQNALRSQDEQLRTAKMNVSIATDVGGITGAQLEEYKNNVSPIEFEQTKLRYLTALERSKENEASISGLASSWNNPESFARISPSNINKGFDVLVNKYVEQRHSQGHEISVEEAEVQIAAAAGGTVPVFVQSISNKLNSSNPAMMDSAARQIDAIYNLNAGRHALRGLSDQDKAVYTQYTALRDSLPPDEAAKIAIQNANQDPDTQLLNKEKWSAYLKKQSTGLFGVPPIKFILNKAGYSKDDFINPGTADVYGNSILQKFGAYYQMTNGDETASLKLLKKHVEENYGETKVNGGNYVTLHPLEKVLGYEGNSKVVPYIHQDIIRQISPSFAESKKLYDQKLTNEYWEVLPSEKVIEVKRTVRTGGLTTKSDKYQVVILGNAFNWDISLKSDSGIFPLPQIAPYLGVMTYSPDKKFIDAQYLRNHGNGK